MSEDSIIYASQALLRMSMDKFLIYDINLLTTYEITIGVLLEAIPQPSWDTFVSYALKPYRKPSLTFD
jgi:hypothetical protein